MQRSEGWSDAGQRRALVLGLGRFGGGREAARFLARRGFALRVADRATSDTLAESIAALSDLDVEWRLGTEDPSVLDAVDLVVVNPAIPDTNPVLQAARVRGVRLTQEVELFLESYPGRVVIVTGTNGKSTTTTLLASAARRSGLDTLCGGNLGNSLLADEADWRADQLAVLEISSFQLERLDLSKHRVHGAVLTRVTRDHVDRHGSLQAYRDAKSVAARIADGFVVHAADDPVAAAFETSAVRRLVHRRGPGRPGDAAWLEDDHVVLGGPARDAGRLLRLGAMALVGEFHADNAMAAALAAVECGAARAEAGFAIAMQRPLPFRLQLATVRDGVRYWDNAVSTALETTDSALDSLVGRVHWVGGGKSKEGPNGYRRFATAIGAKVATAHVFGAAAGPLSEELVARGVTTTRHERLEDALAAARDAARPGDMVLFSPGFASFDQFPNFRARAAAFRVWLRAPTLEPEPLEASAG